MEMKRFASRTHARFIGKPFAGERPDPQVNVIERVPVELSEFMLDSCVRARGPSQGAKNTWKLPMCGK